MKSQRLPVSMLPTDENIIFPQSSFFRRHARLPSTTEVRAGKHLKLKYEQTVHTMQGAEEKRVYWVDGPVIFEDLGLLVKFGGRCTISEGQCLHAIRQLCRDAVPVPEVYGWATDLKGIFFLYMELVPGSMRLFDHSDVMNDEEKTSVSDQVGQIVKDLRLLQQDPDDQFVGSITRKRLSDRALPQYKPDCIPGPFLPQQDYYDLRASSPVQDFNDWLSSLAGWDAGCGLQEVISQGPDLLRRSLPDKAPIKFTHGNLCLQNILVTCDGPPTVTAIGNWAQAGWLPGYWESCKMLAGAWSGHDWYVKYVPRILDTCESIFKAVESYSFAADPTAEW